MARPKQSQEQVEAMRERILDAAMALANERGAEALSIRTIADRVGVSHMVLYTYFENRAALMGGLVERQQTWMLARQADLLPRPETADPRQAVGQALAFYAQVARQHPWRYRLAWMSPSLGSEHAAQRHRRLQTHLALLTRLIQSGIEQGGFVDRDPFLAAATAFATVNAPIILFSMGLVSYPTMRDRMVEEALQTAMSYLCGERVGPPGESWLGRWTQGELWADS